MKKTKKLLRQIIEEKIASRIRTENLQQLPSTCDLSMEFGVAQRTVLEAIHSLADKGVVLCCQGKRIQVVKSAATDAAIPTTVVNSMPAFYEKLKREIIEGVRRIGQRLPKLDYFTLTEHIALERICSALRLLEKQNLIHKQGKKWIVGPAQPAYRLSQQQRLAKAHKILLILVRDFHKWTFFAKESAGGFGSLFFQTFIKEIENYGFTVKLAYMSAAEPDRCFPKGREQIQAWMQSLGESYRGTAIFEDDREHFKREEWIKWLLYFKKPVIWYGIEPDLPYFNRAELEDGEYYAYSRYNEQAGVELAIKTLVDLGHRTIAYPVGALPHPWIPRRLDIIRTFLSKYCPKANLVIIEQRESFWSNEDWPQKENAFDSFLKMLGGSPPPKSGTGMFAASCRAALIKAVPSLAVFLHQPKPTALVAPNDMLARFYKAWFDAVGICVPDDVSLIGFDNDARSHHFPLSTIDFGFGELGYCVAHFIIGDIPVSIDKSGEIRAPCVLIDRGSLAAPKPP